jgi:hypothetical protein
MLGFGRCYGLRVFQPALNFHYSKFIFVAYPIPVPGKIVIFAGLSNRKDEGKEMCHVWYWVRDNQLLCVGKAWFRIGIPVEEK